MAFPVVASSTTDGSKPSGLAVGDLIVASLSCLQHVDPGAGTVSAPSTGGWTTLYADRNFGIFYKYAQAADVAASNLSPGAVGSSGGSTADSNTVSVLRITGIDPGTAVQLSTTGAWSGTAPSIAGLTPTVMRCMLLFILLRANKSTSAGSASGYAAANNNPAWTEVVDVDTSGTAGTERSGQAVAWGNYGALTTTGAVSAVYTPGTGGGVIGLLAIQPAKLTPTPSVAMSLIVNAATLVGRVIATTPAVMNLILGTPVLSHLTSLWKNTGKHDASWDNTDKSS